MASWDAVKFPKFKGAPNFDDGQYSTGLNLPKNSKVPLGCHGIVLGEAHGRKSIQVLPVCCDLNSQLHVGVAKEYTSTVQIPSELVVAVIAPHEGGSKGISILPHVQACRFQRQEGWKGSLPGIQFPRAKHLGLFSINNYSPNNQIRPQQNIDGSVALRKLNDNMVLIDEVKEFTVRVQAHRLVLQI